MNLEQTKAIWSNLLSAFEDLNNARHIVKL